MAIRTFCALPDEAAAAHLCSGLAAIACRHPAVGLAIGVVRDGRLETFFAHGLADIASRTPVTEDTVFRIGSITKTFTASPRAGSCGESWRESRPPAP
jgi:CubicO group peptidase (beta-lactamase class C family)